MAPTLKSTSPAPSYLGIGSKDSIFEKISIISHYWYPQSNYASNTRLFSRTMYATNLLTQATKCRCLSIKAVQAYRPYNYCP